MKLTKLFARSVRPAAHGDGSRTGHHGGGPCGGHSHNHDRGATDSGRSEQEATPTATAPAGTDHASGHGHAAHSEA